MFTPESGGGGYRISIKGENETTFSVGERGLTQTQIGFWLGVVREGVNPKWVWGKTLPPFT